MFAKSFKGFPKRFQRVSNPLKPLETGFLKGIAKSVSSGFPILTESFESIDDTLLVTLSVIDQRVISAKFITVLIQL